MELLNRRRLIASLVGLIIGLNGKASRAQATPTDNPLGLPFLPQPATPHSHPSFAEPDAHQMLWASKALTRMQTVHVGMTRADMEGVFGRAGGFYVTPATVTLGGVYSYRECPYIKVEVEFQPARKPQRDASDSVWTPEDGQDIITRISKPFLEQVYSD